MIEEATALDGRVAPATSPVLDLIEARHAVDLALREFLDAKRRSLTGGAGAPLGPVIDLLSALVAAGGKRLRPLLCLCGWHAAGGTGERGPVVRAAAALELFHMFALIHDDVIDGSDTRRGRPTARRAVGDDAAILVGDLALVWSDELMHASGTEPALLHALRPLLDAMRTELMLGQYLDLLATRDEDADVETGLTVLHYKSAKYTVERPLQIGAMLAGADSGTLAACSRFAVPIGEAFQLRDDLLGIFGDPTVTGKSRLDDLRDGKGTTLLALARGRADPAQREVLLRLVGDPSLDEAGARAVRDVLVSTGAAAAVEDMIRERERAGLAALAEAPFTETGRAALRRIARAAVTRTS
ncbi:polyprenyl synthetase family protein [Actinomadura roseirufa]|uniref:polyprenyl synthetase family protein n=1 Tax=Actinomadura roseirufa TaxID=2094049 RepID=UPI001040F18F|nr:polyprenyl synthetase family protein [Actinomadura roseirufa]